jgi:large subunit ribosomal protein L17
MRHHDKNRKFNRKKDQRNALLKSLAANLILNEKIRTTEAKAKELRPYVEKMITKGKNVKVQEEGSGQNDVATIRHLARYLPEKAHRRLINEVAPRYQQRNGGYTRIIKLGPRKTDGADIAIIELVK